MPAGLRVLAGCAVCARVATRAASVRFTPAHGDRAADALAKQLLAEGIGASRIEFPKGMDANEYAPATA